MLGLVVAAWSGVGPAAAAPRLYAGSLSLHAFGNDTTTGSALPYCQAVFTAIPRAGRCLTMPYQAQEIFTFPTREAGSPSRSACLCWLCCAGFDDTTGDGSPRTM